MFEECPRARTCTIILRGGAEQFIEETERSLHDAIMIVRRAIKNDAVVAGQCCDLVSLFRSAVISRLTVASLVNLFHQRKNVLNKDVLFCLSTLYISVQLQNKTESMFPVRTRDTVSASGSRTSDGM